MYIPLIESIKHKIRNRKIMWMQELEREEDSHRESVPTLWAKLDRYMRYCGRVHVEYVNLLDGTMRIRTLNASGAFRVPDESAEVYIGYVRKGRPDDFENLNHVFLIRDCRVETGETFLDEYQRQWTEQALRGEITVIGNEMYLQPWLRHKASAGMEDVVIIADWEVI